MKIPRKGDFLRFGLGKRSGSILSQAETENIIPVAAQGHIGGKSATVEADGPLGIAGDILGVGLLGDGPQGIPYGKGGEDILLLR